MTNRVANRANIVSMVTSALTMGTLLVLIKLKILPLGWSWLVILGTFGTFGLGWLLGPVLDKDARDSSPAPAPAR